LERAVVAIDGSPASDEALMFACSIAEVEHTRLVLCTVIESSGHYADELDTSELLNDEKERKAAELLESSLVKAKGQRIDAESVQLKGAADSAIVGLAASTNADCIFTGTHGRAGIPRFLLGSVAEGILRSSPVPVCTVRYR
jgi:nucleotide-binding universal stress UspA family protein